VMAYDYHLQNLNIYEKQTVCNHVSDVNCA